MRTILLATMLLVTACKKSEDKKPAEPAVKTDDKAAPAVSPDKKIATPAEYETLGIDVTNKLLALFGADGKDCDKLATDLTKFGEDNRKLFEALDAYGKANPEVAKAFDQKMEAREKEFEEKLGPAFEACRNHEGMKNAMKSMPTMH
jgi:hypothetical protein